MVTKKARMQLKQHSNENNNNNNKKDLKHSGWYQNIPSMSR